MRLPSGAIVGRGSGVSSLSSSSFFFSTWVVITSVAVGSLAMVDKLVGKKARLAAADEI